MQVRTRVTGADDFARRLRIAERGFTEVHVRQVQRALATVASEARNQAPKGPTEYLTHSIRASPVRVGSSGQTLVGEVVVNAPYGFFVQRGRRAGARMPPYRAIERWLQWAQGSFITRRDVFAVRRSIARRGIRPNDFLGRAFARTKGQVRDTLRGFGRQTVLLIRERNPFL